MAAYFKMFKTSTFVQFVLILLPLGLSAQHLGYSLGDIVFVDNAHLRAEPNTKAKIVGQLPHGYKLKVCQNRAAKRDTIGGKPGYWMEVSWNTETAFIWQNVMADGQIMSKQQPQFKLIFKIFDSVKVSFKLFEHNQYLEEFVFDIGSKGRFAGFYNYGKTWNSKGKEIIALVFYKGNSISYKLYEWQAKHIEESNINLADESLLTGKYLDFDESILNAKGVNIRKGPSDTTESLGTLPKYSRLTLSKAFIVSETKLNKYYQWHQIKYKDTIAYIRADFLDIPYRYTASNYTKDLRFLSTNNAIYVFKNGEILDRCLAAARDEDRLENFGNRGFDAQYEFVAVCYSAHSCGQAGGDRYYRWDGKNLKFFCNDYTVGDGGYSDGHNFIFPDEDSSLKNEVKLVNWSGEATNESNSGCQDGFSDILFEETYLLRFDGDTLVEVPSKHSKLRSLIQSEFNGMTLGNYGFYDLNNDGIEDVVFHLVDRNYYESSGQNKPDVLGYAFGGKNQFNKVYYTQKLIQPGLHNALFAFENSQLKVSLRYYVGWYAEETDANAYLEEFWYEYDTASNKLIWKRYRALTNMATKEDRSIIWGNEKSQVFSKNKVYFEDSWGGQ